MKKIKWILLFFLICFYQETWARTQNAVLLHLGSLKKNGSNQINWSSKEYPVIIHKKNGAKVFTVTLFGTYLEKNGTLLYLMSNKSRPIPLSSGKPEDRDFQIKVSTEENKIQFKIISISSTGVSIQNEYEIEMPVNDEEFIQLEAKSKFQLKHFRLFAVSFSNIYSSLTSISGSWNPTYQNSRFRLEGMLGFSALRNSDSFYLGIDYGVNGAVRVLKYFWLEALAGMQYMSGFNVHAPILGANIIYDLGRPRLFRIDQLIVGYTAYLVPDSTIIEIKLGVGFHF